MCPPLKLLRAILQTVQSPSNSATLRATTFLVCLKLKTLAVLQHIYIPVLGLASFALSCLIGKSQQMLPEMLQRVATSSENCCAQYCSVCPGLNPYNIPESALYIQWRTQRCLKGENWPFLAYKRGEGQKVFAFSNNREGLGVGGRPIRTLPLDPPHICTYAYFI